MNDKFNVISLT